MSALNVTIKGDITLKRQLAALSLPAKKRAQFHRKMGREVIKQSKKRVREQRALNGQRLAPRKDGKAKVLRRIMRSTKVYAGANKVKVTWPNSLTGKIASAQQEGISETVTARDMKQRHGTPDYSSPATAAQAKALIKAGYRLPGGKYKGGQKKGQQKSKRVSGKWIQENMTLGQAGLVLRMLEGRSAADSWKVELEPRPFFGLSKTDVTQLANNLIDDLTRDVKRIL